MKSFDNDFIAEFLGEFKPDKRLLELENKLAKYYSDSENVSNREAFEMHKKFNIWCHQNGYTRDEVNRAKRNFRG